MPFGAPPVAWAGPRPMLLPGGQSWGGSPSSGSVPAAPPLQPPVTIVAAGSTIASATTSVAPAPLTVQVWTHPVFMRDLACHDPSLCSHLKLPIGRPCRFKRADGASGGTASSANGASCSRTPTAPAGHGQVCCHCCHSWSAHYPPTRGSAITGTPTSCQPTCPVRQRTKRLPFLTHSTHIPLTGGDPRPAAQVPQWIIGQRVSCIL